MIFELCLKNDKTGKSTWLDLPYREDELLDAFVGIGVGYYDEGGDYHKNDKDDKCVIHEVEIDLDGLEDEINLEDYKTLESINNLADSLHGFKSYDYEKIGAIMRVQGESIEGAVMYLNETTVIPVTPINETDDSENVRIAKAYIDEVYYGTENMSIEKLTKYFDFEKYGEELNFKIDEETNLAVALSE